MGTPFADSDGARYDWRIYADATCAGLSVLIPLPVVDIVFETIFRRRIPGSISRARGRRVPPDVKTALSRPVDGLVSWEGCLTVPFKILRYVLRRLWRKIIYIFAVKDATTALTEYWHRAFLIDHMLRAGHLDANVDTALAVRVFRQVLHDVDPSPLTEVARQTVANVRHVFRLLLRAHRLGAAEVTKSIGEMLSSHSKSAAESLVATSRLYDQRYAFEVAARERAG